MNRNIYYLPQVQSILTHLTNYNIAQHIIKNYTIDETTEKYQNIIDQLQFLTKEHNYQINRKDGRRLERLMLFWSDTPFYVYILTTNMWEHEFEPSIYLLYEKLFKKQYDKKYGYKSSKRCIHCNGEFFKLSEIKSFEKKKCKCKCKIYPSRCKCRCLYNYIPKKINISQ